MELIKINEKNLDLEHICCALSGSEAQPKKDWLKERLKDGLVFLKANVRGKCFIEYIPAENAWSPICADGYMYINCLWVSGQFKGHGYSNLLLDECIRDSKEKGKKGLVILSSKKKTGFLADPKYLRYKGFRLADTAQPYFELMYLPFEENSEKPYFREQVKGKGGIGFELFYTAQCPFTTKYVPILEQMAKDKNAPFTVTKYETAAQAQNGISPFSTFSLYFDGEFITHEILSEKKFEKILAERGF